MKNITFYEEDSIYYKLVIKNKFLCSEWPEEWPCWVGGNEDFINQKQPFDKLEELKKAYMLEF